MMPRRIDLNRDWEFTENYTEGFLRGEASEEVVSVELPHTCKEVPFHYFDESIYQMVCGYRKRIMIPAEALGKRIFLEIGAAGHYAEVYVNGARLSSHRCGYTAFLTELTEFVKAGEEALVVVRVDSRETLDQPPFGYVIDYMTYGGLYREVSLLLCEQSYLSDVFVHPVIPEGEAMLNGSEDRSEIEKIRFIGAAGSSVTLDGPVCGDFGGFSLRQMVYPYGSETAGALSQVDFELSKLPPKTACDEVPGRITFELSLPVPNARLWDIDSPNLYTVETQLCLNGVAIDREMTVIGFRRARFEPDGFYLNGRKLRIVGLNRHQSYPYAGYAMPRSLQRLDADLLKNELGLNAVRTSHYPQSHHFIRRCDEIGLLVFTEIPGWQHIGSADWKSQAVINTAEMIIQYRNHPSIILWGVRINESVDDDEFYEKTNEVAHRLDPTRQTGGVRYHKKSHLLEDVYTYNDFIHSGKNPGCDRKKSVTSDMSKPYLISEYNGHMYPTKLFDDEEHRAEHALRHANVLNAVAGESDIAGSFGWCMFDYNTHADFGSGDRICYHGVMDMFRNPKLAADVYSVSQDQTPVLSVSSSMEIGDHPAGNRGRIYLFSNADSVKMYKNDHFIREYTHESSQYRNLARGPIEITDFIGDTVAREEHFKPRKAKYVTDVLNHYTRFGMEKMPFGVALKAGILMTCYRMSFADAYALYGKYVGNWGGEATVYRFEAIKNGEVVKTVLKAPVKETHITANADHTVLSEDATYDAALIRIAMKDQNDNILPFADSIVTLESEGPIAVIGPKQFPLRGGMGGTFVKTVGESGKAALTVSVSDADSVRIEFDVHNYLEKEADKEGDV